MYNRHNVQKKVTPVLLSRKKIGNMTTCSKARPVDALPNPRLWHCLCGEIKSNHTSSHCCHCSTFSFFLSNLDNAAALMSLLLSAADWPPPSAPTLPPLPPPVPLPPPPPPVPPPPPPPKVCPEPAKLFCVLPVLFDLPPKWRPLESWDGSLTGEAPVRSSGRQQLKQFPNLANRFTYPGQGSLVRERHNSLEKLLQLHANMLYRDPG